ncbi:ribonuclease H-like domain, reverse transcriptase, RNA-dependent DNA polymerase [Tanacetum coccineum]
MKEDETIDTFTTKLTTLINKAASLGHTMEDETLVRKLLNAVPDRGRGRGRHKFSQGRNHENFKEERKDGETSHRSYDKNNFKKSTYDTSKVKCYKCKKLGHIAPDCPLKTRPNEQSNLVEEDLEPTLLMAIIEVEEQEVSLHEENVGYKETNMDSLNLEVTNKHHDHETQPLEEDNEFPNNNDDDYASPRNSPLHPQTPHTPSTHSITRSKFSITPKTTTQSNIKVNRINSNHDLPSHFDHTPVRGFRTLKDLYENTEELLLAEDEPKNYKEASSDQKWIEAMEVELDSINRNNTWKLTTCYPKRQKSNRLKMGIKTKRDANGNIIKHKARLVAKGYIQEHGIDFEEVFAPVARMETIRLLLAIAANNKWEVHHLDVKSAFLHGDLKEEVYVTQPEGFIKRQDNGKVYRLIKALYGLRQAPPTEVNPQEGKGTTGIIFYYGESPISWSTQKQATVALSSCESEFIATTAAATQALWLKRLLSKLTHTQEEKITIQVDNKSAIALMKNPVFHGRSNTVDTNITSLENRRRETYKSHFEIGVYRKQTYSQRHSRRSNS